MTRYSTEDIFIKLLYCCNKFITSDVIVSLNFKTLKECFSRVFMAVSSKRPELEFWASRGNGFYVFFVRRGVSEGVRR